MLANIFPGIKIGVFRATYTSLNESITEKLLAMLPKDLKDKPGIGWKYVKKDNQIKFLHNGSVIKLCYCDSLQDAYKYRGWEFDVLIIDEECDLDDATVAFLKGTLRTAKFVTYEDGTPCRYPIGHEKRYLMDKDGNPTEELAYVKYLNISRSSVNPEGNGFIRVRDQFVRPTNYGKKVLERVKTLRNGVQVIRRRAFIQAKMEDNKFLNEDYELQFEGMSEAERLKNVEGNWDVSDSNFFRKFKSAKFAKGGHIIDDINEILNAEEREYVEPGQEFPNWFKCFGSLDWGFYPDYAALAVWYVGGNHVVKRYELLWNNLAINEAAQKILKLQEEYNFKMETLFVPHDMARAGELYQNSKGEVLGDTKEKVLAAYGIRTIVTRGERAEGWDKVHQLQAEMNSDGTPLFKIHSSCVKTIAQYQTLARDHIKYKDIRNGQEDHCADSDRYFAVPYSRFLNQDRAVVIELSHRDKLIKKFGNKNIKNITKPVNSFIR